MGVVEVRGDGNDNVIDGVTQSTTRNSLVSPWY
jgi:hypothetical protein